MNLSTLINPPTEEGVSIPENSLHAVSVSLPKWKDNIAYEEGDPIISQKIKSGYPRFKIHFKIEELARRIEKDFGRDGESAMIFSLNRAARRCRDFIKAREPNTSTRVLQISCPTQSSDALGAQVSVVFLPSEKFSLAKQYWQHTGEGVSSRMAQYFFEKLEEYQANEKKVTPSSFDKVQSLLTQPQEIFVEERFGRYLSQTLAKEAKPVLKKRIAQEISRRGKVPVTADLVKLYPSGMTAIFSAYRTIMEAFQVDTNQLKAVCFGFPYTDTLKILQKWGPGAVFYPHGDDEGDLVKLEHQLRNGEINVSSLFCEVPSNPLLNTPNLIKLRQLADEFKFVIVIDDTVGNMANVNTTGYADIGVSSLTKIFSGDCNVMAGNLVLNPLGPFFKKLKCTLESQFGDGFWAEDAIYLERNSRDFFDRSHRINANAEAVVELLVKYQKNTGIIKNIYYPTVSKSRANYDSIKYEDGGYGGLLSVVFNHPQSAIAFYDSLFIAKGPSLGTNFTLGCPYTIIAHYNELDFVKSCGVDTHLVRISVGLEKTPELLRRFEISLKAAQEAVSNY